jgi:hypothetical protein
MPNEIKQKNWQWGILLEFVDKFRVSLKWGKTKTYILHTDLRKRMKFQKNFIRATFLPGVVQKSETRPEGEYTFRNFHNF